MTLSRKFIAVLAGLIASKHSIASSAGAGLVGAWLAPALGFDPWTWIIGAIGGILIRTKLPPTTRIDSVVNGVISVMLAGLGAPVIIGLISSYTMFEKLPHMTVYLAAFMLSMAWPWIVQLGWGLAKRKSDKWGDA